MKDISGFQVAVLVICGLLGILAVMIFGGFLGKGVGTGYAGEVTLWGTIPDSYLSQILNDFNQANSDKFSLKYEYHMDSDFEDDLVQALARGAGPDIIFLPQDLIVKHEDKIYPIPYATLSERDFMDTYADIGNIYLTSSGILGLPYYIDPMVMYWNKDIFSSSGVVSYPKVWGDFLDLPRILTKRDDAGNIKQAAVALGSFRNITHAKDILSTLFLQVGEKVVVRVPDVAINNKPSEKFSVRFAENENFEADNSALRFYTEFANEAKEAYSWNNSLPNSRSYFTSGNLGVYFGRASDFNLIKKNNTHLNFDVAPVPQRDTAKKKSVFGDVKALAVLKSSQNPNAAFTAISALAEAEVMKEITQIINLPPARRDLLAQETPDPIMSIFYDSAIVSSTWLDPDKAGSELVFKNIVDSVLSGKVDMATAIYGAGEGISQLLK